MFDEVIFRANLATKIKPGFLVVARFGPERVKSLVAVSQTLDKLIVHESSLDITLSSKLENSIPPYDDDFRPGFSSKNAGDLIAVEQNNNDNGNGNNTKNAPFYYITIRDIIKSLGSHSLKSDFDVYYERDILLIGCVNSIIIYDTLTQSKQINVNTSGPVELIAICNSNLNDYCRAKIDGKIEINNRLGKQDQQFGKNYYDDLYKDNLIVCYGAQKLYTIKLDAENNLSSDIRFDGSDNHDSNNQDMSKPMASLARHFVGELTSERSIGETITCLIQGDCSPSDCNLTNTSGATAFNYGSINYNNNSLLTDKLVITGSREAQIRLWPLDNFDQNLQACRVVIGELGPVTCLYPINTTTVKLTGRGDNVYTVADEHSRMAGSPPTAAGGSGDSFNRSSASASTIATLLASKSKLSSLSSDRQNQGEPSSSTSRYRVESPVLPPVGAKQQAVENSASSSNQKHQLQSNVGAAPTEVGLTVYQKGHESHELMNYFAYGLENNYIGVYRLYSNRTMLNDVEEPGRVGSQRHQATLAGRKTLMNDNDEEYSSMMMMNILGDGPVDKGSFSIANTIASSPHECERLWRLKTRHKPIQMIMYDVDGDGQDELIIGYKNGRLEARAPFTGQLLSATRSFRGSDSLVALIITTTTSRSSSDAQSGGRSLIALSTSGQLIGYSPRQMRPRQPLRTYGGEGAVTHSTINRQRANQSMDSKDLVSAVSPERLGGFGDEMMSMIMMSSSMVQVKESDQLSDDAGMQNSSLATNIDSGQANDLNDVAKPKSVQAKQSLDQLHNLNTLETQLIGLQKESRALLMERHKQESMMLHQLDVKIGHQWDLDIQKMAIRFSILFNSQNNMPQMVEIIDREKVFFADGSCLIGNVKQNKSTSTKGLHDKLAEKISTTATSLESTQQRIQHVEKRKWSHIVSVLVRPLKNQATELRIKVHCSQSGTGQQQNAYDTSNQQGSRSDFRAGYPVMSHVCSKLIKVPRYNMYVLVPAKLERLVLQTKRLEKTQDQPDFNSTGTTCIHETRDHDQSSSKSLLPLPASSSPPIKLVYWLQDTDSFIYRVSEWAQENFLSYQFVNNVDDLSSPHEAGFSSLTNADPKAFVNSDQNDIDSEGQCDYELKFLDLRDLQGSSSESSTSDNSNNYQPKTMIDFLNMVVNNKSDQDSSFNFVRVAISRHRLELETKDPELLIDIIQSLDVQATARFHDCQIDYMTDQLDEMIENEHQLEESERRTQSELYESADYTKQLLQELGTAIELDEFITSRDLLNEISIILNGAQNAAQAHKLNTESRKKLTHDIRKIKDKIELLTGGQNAK